jgi:hypothetical protein
VVLAEGGEGDKPPAPASDVLKLKWQDVKSTKQVKPVVPPFAKLPRPIRCEIVFTIDEAGVPSDVQVDSCPELMQPNAKKAANKWRFEPVMREGQARKASFKVILKIDR